MWSVNLRVLQVPALSVSWIGNLWLTHAYVSLFSEYMWEQSYSVKCEFTYTVIKWIVALWSAFSQLMLKVHPLSSDGYVKVVGFENECSNSCIGFQDLESVCSYSQVCQFEREMWAFAGNGSLVWPPFWWSHLQLSDVFNSA